MISFFRSFVFAFSGLIVMFKGERNFKIQFIIFLFVCALGFYFEIAKIEWLIILGISTLVLALEIMNSAIERLCNLYSTEFDPRIKTIKDLAAGAVLLTSIFSIAIGIIIFWKYLFK